MRFFVSCLLSLCLFGIHTSAHSEEVQTEKTKIEVYDLDRLIELSLSNSPQLHILNADTDYYRARFGEAKHSWMPRIEWNSFIAPMPEMKDEGDVDFGVFDNLDSMGIFLKTDFKVILPLFTFGKISNSKKLAKIGVDISTLEEKKGEEKIIYEVTQLYQGIQLTKAALNVMEEGYSKLRDAQSTLQKYMDEGADFIDDTDQFELDYYMYELEIQLTNIRAKLAYLKDLLRIHPGIKGDFDLPKMKFRAKIKPLKSLDKLMELTFSSRPEVAQLDRIIAGAEVAVDLQKSNFAPDLFFAFSVGYSYSNAVEDSKEPFVYDPYNSFGMGILLGLKWNLDLAKQIHRLDQIKAKREGYYHQKELAYKGIKVEVSKTYQDTQTKSERVKWLKKQKRTTKSWFQKEFLDFDMGSGKAKDLLGALARYMKARLDYVTAISEYRISLANLKRVTGAGSLEDLLAADEN